MSEAMQKRMRVVEGDMAELKGMFRRVMVRVAGMTGNIAEIKRNMATKADISALNERMDGFSGLLLDSRQRWAVHADTLQQHHDRLTKLEGRRA